MPLGDAQLTASATADSRPDRQHLRQVRLDESGRAPADGALRARHGRAARRRAARRRSSTSAAARACSPSSGRDRIARPRRRDRPRRPEAARGVGAAVAAQPRVPHRARRRAPLRATASSRPPPRWRCSSTCPTRTAVLAEMARVASRWLLVSVPREPLWRALNMARGAYLRDLGNTPGPPEPLVQAQLRAPARPLRRDRRAALAAALDDGARPRRERCRPRREAAEGGMSYGRGAALLSALIGVTGLLTYAFHSLAAHALGRDGYGVDRRAVGGGVPDRLGDLPARRAAALAHDRGAPGAATARSARRCGWRRRSSSASRPSSWSSRCSLKRRSRTSSSRAARRSTGASSRRSSFYAASYFARGFLAGQRRFGLYGGLVLMESASRVVFARAAGGRGARRRRRGRASRSPPRRC